MNVASRIRAEARARDVYFHVRPGRRRFVPISSRPVVLGQAQRRYLQRLCLELERAAIEVFRRRWGDPELARLLPFEPEEERWLRDAYGGCWTRPERLFTRMDLGGRMFARNWRAMRILECNLVGIGATYYCHAAGEIVRDVVAPHLALEDDILELIARRCGARRIALMEYTRLEQGPHEFATISRILNARGWKTVVADPIDIRVRGGRLWARGRRVDVVYRDPTLAELIDMEADGDDLRGVKWALRHNRVVSSLAGEVDHKSLLEILPRFVPAWARRHLPWTRAIRDGRATDPRGRVVDLGAYVARYRERLVIKPNRDYGGSGVVFGDRVSARAWERELDAWMRAPYEGVVQERQPLRRERLPGLPRPVYVVGGVHATERGVATLARYSEEPVVNITRGGGIMGVLVNRKRR